VRVSALKVFNLQKTFKKKSKLSKDFFGLAEYFCFALNETKPFSRVQP
jgi:hypothetical protein